MITFSVQYPSFLFPGQSQYSSEKAPLDLHIYRWVHSCSPLNWIRVGQRLKKIKPTYVIVKFWMPFMAPCFGTILRIAKRNKYTKIICIVDNMVPHEKRWGDHILTNYFMGPIDQFIAMSEVVKKDIETFTAKPTRLIPHPLYDNFGESISMMEARKDLQLPLQATVLLFFGIIRSYKGLDMLLLAMSKVSNDVVLLVAGEFYENKKKYQDIIQEKQLQKRIFLHTHFIPNHQVNRYFSACNFVVQPYRHATQSGVTPLAYHFNKPMLVTKVGGLTEIVPHRKVGIQVDPTVDGIASGIQQLIELGEDYFLPYLKEEKKKYSWNAFCTHLLLP